MKERGILFSGPMVRAILDGRKTQTRRVVRSNYGTPAGHMNGEHSTESDRWWCEPGGWVKCSYGVPGDHLWVRETWMSVVNDGLFYRADSIHEKGVGEWLVRAGAKRGLNVGAKWRPSIFMPRAYSRIDLEVTEVRAQRLQDITEEDAKAEGVDKPESWIGVDGSWRTSYRTKFRSLWDSINGKRAPWASNPWVWAITFQRVRP